MKAPALTVDQVREVDRLLVEEYGIRPVQTVENAGRSLAMLARRLLSAETGPEEDGPLLDRPIVVLAGRGRNGAGGLAAARHLHNWGAWIQAVLTHSPAEFVDGPARQQLSILQRMNVPLAWAEEGWELPPADLVIDALIGYGLAGAPGPRVAELIHLANSSVAPTLSLDVPSGLDAKSGVPGAPHVAAAATMALALPKSVLLQGPAQAATGPLFLADTGVPPELYERLGIEAPHLFSSDTVVSLAVVNGEARVEETRSFA